MRAPGFLAAILLAPAAFAQSSEVSITAPPPPKYFGTILKPFHLEKRIVPPAKLSDAQLTLIWDYLDQPPQPTTGQALYHDYCANCHGADGKGGPTTRPIVNELAELKKQVRAGAHLGEFDMRREYMPAFTTGDLTDAEVDLIYNYVDSL